MKILAIDDNRDNLTTLLAVLKDAIPGCLVSTALNGPEGIALARAEDPDVILLDIIMPGMDGFEVCRRLKADEVLQIIPVVFLTATRTDRESRIKALAAGAEAFLNKPTDEQELIAQIRAMVKIKAANQQQRQEKSRLEALVAERTGELQQELAERKLMEKALRQSEEKFKAMVETIPLAIYMSTGVDQIAEYMNPEFSRLLGYTLEDIPAVGRWWPLAYPDEEYRRKISAEWEKKVKQAIASQTAIEPMEVEVTCKDGSKKTICWGFITLGDKNYAYGLDLTTRKQAEEERRLFTEELARSNIDLQQFAYVASHDLQEPLRMISSYLQLIERRYKDRLDNDANTFIHFAVDGANRMQALINGLLEFSRITTHGKAFAEVDIRQVLDGVCRDLQPLIRESGATVHSDRLPSIRGDEPQLVRLFQNLLHNSLKFRKEAIPPAITISAETAGGLHVFCVRDNGIGIERDYFERIFTIFQRLHTREQYPGTGIGLSICKRIVERHHGSIWLESSPGEGTAFYFSIPGDTQ